METYKVCDECGTRLEFVSSDGNKYTFICPDCGKIVVFIAR